MTVALARQLLCASTEPAQKHAGVLAVGFGMYTLQARSPSSMLCVFMHVWMFALAHVVPMSPACAHVRRNPQSGAQSQCDGPWTCNRRRPIGYNMCVCGRRRPEAHSLQTRQVALRTTRLAARGLVCRRFSGYGYGGRDARAQSRTRCISRRIRSVGLSAG